MFIKNCPNEVTHELLLNDKRIYVCHNDLLKILASGGVAHSVKVVDILILEQKKYILIEQLISSHQVLKFFSESLQQMNRKMIRDIIEEQNKILTIIDSLSVRFIEIIAQVKAMNSIKSYEKLPELFKLLLENDENIKPKYESFKLFEVSYKKLNGINTALVKDNFSNYISVRVPEIESKCPQGHNLFLSFDSKEYYRFRMSGHTEVKCDECGKILDSASFHCRLCSYDICSSCYSEKNFKPRSVPRCRNNHETEMVLGINKHFMSVRCDTCCKEINKNSWRCQICDYDMCENCAMSLFIQPRFEYPLTCLNSHRLLSFFKVNSFICFTCFKRESNIEAWKCKECKYKLCQACAQLLGHRNPKCQKAHNMIHKKARKKGFGWFKSCNCGKCGAKVDDNGFTCRACDTFICEPCLLTTPSITYNP